MKHGIYSISDLQKYFEDICEPNAKGKRHHRLKRKDVLFEQGQVATAFAFVLSGKLNVIKRHEESDFIITSIGAGEIVGEMGLFLSEKTRTSSVVADENTKVLMINYDAFMESLATNYLPLLHMTKIMAARLHSTTKHADSIATKGMKDRLIDLLLNMEESSMIAMNSDGSYTFKMSRKEMALRIGCSRELAGRYLSELRDSGYLKLSGMTITVMPKIKNVE